ncbi:MAG: hypothetical protein HYT07_00900 [Candidatus Levybacteria bacterium]|nr:hypothetical protein [Candidatus Levybacteria bacterium]
MLTERSLPSQDTSRLKISHDKNVGGLHPLLKVEGENGTKSIPILSVREKAHHEAIANAMVSGDAVAFEVGVVGLMIAVGDKRLGGNAWKTFWEVKKGRAPEDKVPFMMLPEDHDKVVDFTKIHEDFQFLKDAEARKKFFGALPFHTILPIREDNESLNRNAFVTTPEETLKKPADQRLSESTVCIYWQGGDTDWRRIAELAKKINPDVYLGITSLNEHGKPSPWNFSELLKHIEDGRGKELNHIVQDPVIAKADIKSSHTQVRVPLKGEKPAIIIVRKGPISADTINKFTGFPVRTLESAKLASRGHSPDVSLDERILEHLQKVNRA